MVHCGNCFYACRAYSSRFYNFLFWDRRADYFNMHIFVWYRFDSYPDNNFHNSFFVEFDLNAEIF